MGTEGVPGPAMEESLSSRLQWLQQRREALQEKLAQKNNELKNLCIEEAELTGVLPPEIPLEAGESPPTFRRRVGTAFTYPQNLINKLKSSEAEESALELERQVQVGIAEAALSIFNDAAESKAVRRKHRLVYQQSQRRLLELDARLNFIRQSHGKSHHQTQLPQALAYGTQPHPQAHVKHRTKKPRPPLDSTGSEGSTKSSRGVLQEGGVSLSPLGPEHNYNTFPGHGYQEADHAHPAQSNVYNYNRIVHPAVNPISHRHSPKHLEHDLNDNHNIYILPDQYRTRTYSHGSGGSRNYNHYPDAERNYRPVPNTYTEQERQMRYRQLQQLQQQVYNHQHYPEYRLADNDVHRHPGQSYYETESHAHRYTLTPDYQPTHATAHSSQRREREMMSSRSSRNTGPPNDPHQPPGYWIRYDDEIVWCPEDQSPDRFGSLDRRKHNTLQHTNSVGADPQSRYHTVGGSKSVSILPRHLLPLNPPPPEPAAPSRMLLRTQSLGSVETWHSGNSQESPDSKDTLDNVSRKGKEKEWYETSLDSGPSPSLGPAPTAVHQTAHPPLGPVLLPATKIPTSRESLRDNQNQHTHRREKPIQEQQLSQPLQHRYHQPKVLEIPAESKLLDTSNEVPLESPKNCTIVQAGKYQPYREVTKPFEMSDFYKYSTKFRKRTENSQAQISPGTNVGATPSPNGGKLPQDPRVSMMVEMSQELRIGPLDDRTVPTPVQKRIYQPLQRMTCQPYNSLRPEDGGEWYMSEKEPASSATLV